MNCYGIANLSYKNMCTTTNGMNIPLWKIKNTNKIQNTKIERRLSNQSYCNNHNNAWMYIKLMCSCKTELGVVSTVCSKHNPKLDGHVQFFSEFYSGCCGLVIEALHTVMIDVRKNLNLNVDKGAGSAFSSLKLNCNPISMPKQATATLRENMPFECFWGW